jgi:hypothetical protein
LNTSIDSWFSADRCKTFGMACSSASGFHQPSTAARAAS